jgi:hypothetical protein
MKIGPKMALGGGAVAATIVAVATVALSPNVSPSSASERACALSEAQLGGFVDIPGGGFVMGVDPVFPEEGPPRRVLVSPFRLQAHEVTNSQFAAFVAQTGYVTEAELGGGSAQFARSETPEVFLSWWSLDAGATWRTPDGVRIPAIVGAHSTRSWAPIPFHRGRPFHVIVGGRVGRRRHRFRPGFPGQVRRGGRLSFACCLRGAPGGGRCARADRGWRRRASDRR